MEPSKSYPDAAGKRMASGALVFRGPELLILKPTYKAEWHVPGGLVEDGEGPRAACEREIAEEIGLRLTVRRLLVVDYRHNRGTDHGESVQFVFLADSIPDEDVARIRLPENEISESRLVAPEDALDLLSPYLALRVRAALQAIERGTTLYLENGEGVFPT